MVRYTGKRILTGMFSLLILVAVTFYLVRLIPGSPFQTGNVSEKVVRAMEEQYGLNEPIYMQYATYMKNLLRGDFGISYQEPGTRVTEIIGRAWPFTFSLGIAALIFAFLAGTVLGIIHTVSGNRVIKALISGFGILSAGIPSFVTAILLLLVLSLKLKWLPASGLFTPFHYILPVTALALYPASVTERLTENALSAELNQDYVLYAKAKGLGINRVILTHALKNAMIPVINYIGPASAFLLTGSFAVESIFTIPGLGREFVFSIANRDYTLILGLTVFMGTVVIVVNLVTDLICAWLNPQIRRGYEKKQKRRV